MGSDHLKTSQLWVPRVNKPTLGFFATSGTIIDPDMKVLRCAYQDEMEDIPEGSLPLHLLMEIEKKGDKVALTNGETGEELTFRQLYQQAKNVASGFRRRGFRSGDVLCLMAPNCLQYPVVFLGVTLNGGILTMVSPLHKESELIYQMKDSGADWLLVSSGLEDKARAVAERLGTVREKFLLQGEAEGFTPFHSLLQDPCDMWVPHKQVDPERDPLLLSYSSGTTGLPKGVMLTHRNFAAAYSILRTRKTYPLGQGDVTLLFLPMYHNYGFMMMFTALITDYATVILPGFNPKVFLSTIQNYKVTFIPMAPPVVLFLAKSLLADDFDLSSLRLIQSGAAPLSPEVQCEAQKRLGSDVLLFQGYGLTESTLPTNLCLREKPGSAGTPIGHIQIKVIDVDTRERLGPNKSGEICLKGPQVTPGYYRNPKATANLFDEEGWMKTGDLGYYDEEGFIFIVDRIKELIKYKGFQVAPAELEGVLLSHPDVADAAVVGLPDPRSGELPTAFVVLKPGVSATKKGLQEFVEERVSNYKTLRGGVIFVDVINKNPSGKILRRILKEKLKTLKPKL
ncbi:uncharacterized protein LOC143021924 [Oratosquilla oratoria]|uniref:uncharacterized protein LOC143021924 n=1 Tax=Oratosquilla oratoria TaxID=337810 RepID=UPI003F75FA19